MSLCVRSGAGGDAPAALSGSAPRRGAAGCKSVCCSRMACVLHSRSLMQITATCAVTIRPAAKRSRLSRGSHHHNARAAASPQATGLSAAAAARSGARARRAHLLQRARLVALAVGAADALAVHAALLPLQHLVIHQRACGLAGGVIQHLARPAQRRHRAQARVRQWRAPWAPAARGHGARPAAQRPQVTLRDLAGALGVRAPRKPRSRAGSSPRISSCPIAGRSRRCLQRAPLSNP